MTVRGAVAVDAEEMERGESCTIDAAGGQSWKERESAPLPDRREEMRYRGNWERVHDSHRLFFKIKMQNGFIFGGK